MNLSFRGVKPYKSTVSNETPCHPKTDWESAHNSDKLLDGCEVPLPEGEDEED